jgi:hypothetical protein
VPNSERRRRLPLIVAAVAVLAAVTTVGIVHARTHTTKPSTSPPSQTRVSPSTPASSGRTSASPPPSAAAIPVGITFGGQLFGASRAHIDEAMHDVVSLHMGWVRVDFSWASVQPRSAGAYDWAPLDAIVDAARAHHLRVLGLLTYTPPWARASGCASFVCPPRSDAEFARFAAAAAQRYAGRVGTYQIWNEPNIPLFWPDPDPRAYGHLLTSAVTAMRKVDRGLRILFGGLAFTTDTGSDIAPAQFLLDACRGSTCDVDAVGYDPFTYPGRPSKRTQPPNAWQLITAPGPDGISAAMGQVGLQDKKIWITEFGAPTDYPGSSDARTVTEQQQAAIIVDGLHLAQSESAQIAAYLVDTWRDAKAAGATRDHFGIERSDGTHKPAFAALASALG